jgi:hypothetical protein
MNQIALGIFGQVRGRCPSTNGARGHKSCNRAIIIRTVERDVHKLKIAEDATKRRV